MPVAPSTRAAIEPAGGRAAADPGRMFAATPDDPWGVVLIDRARSALADAADRLAASRSRAASIVDDTAWRASAVAAYRRDAAEWESDVTRVWHDVLDVRADLAATRAGILARAAQEGA
jgi:hypothetical protein